MQHAQAPTNTAERTGRWERLHIRDGDAARVRRSKGEEQARLTGPDRVPPQFLCHSSPRLAVGVVPLRD